MLVSLGDSPGLIEDLAGCGSVSRMRIDRVRRVAPTAARDYIDGMPHGEDSAGASEAECWLVL